jgi:hypothetical protein
MTTRTKANARTKTTAAETSGKPKAPQKAAPKGAAPRHGARVAPKKTKRESKASAAKQTPTARTKRHDSEPKAPTPKAARKGSKTAKVLDLLKRPGGVSSQELMKATGWLPHSVRGFLSGTVGKKMGLTVTSAKGENGGRIYSLES